MEIVEGLAGLRSVPAGGVMSVGNFDGIHRGHQRILETARLLRDGDGGELVAVTFEPHPLTVLRPDKAPPRLTPAGYKRELLARAGVDRLVVLPPTQEVLNLSAEEFWAILRDQARPRHMVEGGSFNFGKNRGGTIQRLREWANGSAIQLRVVESVEVALLDLTIAPVSSSLVRWLIGNGRMRDAGICLGHAYALEGVVVEGFKRGRTIGVPTANLDIAEQLVPMEGVYAGRCAVDGAAYAVALSVGRMQTFGDKLHQQVEAHLIGFAGDLYGRGLRVEVVDWIREQRKFSGIDGLVQRLKQDIELAAQLSARDVTGEIAVIR